MHVYVFQLAIVSLLYHNSKWIKVMYEGMHLICLHCGTYGHYVDECQKKKSLMHTDVGHEHHFDEVVAKELNQQNKILSSGNAKVAQKPLMEFGE